MITEVQKNNIRQMSKTDLLELLDICTEELGLISPKEYCEATFTPRSTFYYLVKIGKIKTFKISEHEFPLINLSASFDHQSQCIEEDFEKLRRH